MAGRSKGRGGNAASPPPPPSFEPSQLCITLPPARCNGPQWAPTAPNGPQCISPSIPGARYTACCACCACCGCCACCACCCDDEPGCCGGDGDGNDKPDVPDELPLYSIY